MSMFKIIIYIHNALIIDQLFFSVKVFLTEWDKNCVTQAIDTSMCENRASIKVTRSHSLVKNHHFNRSE